MKLKKIWSAGSAQFDPSLKKNHLPVAFCLLQDGVIDKMVFVSRDVPRRSHGEWTGVPGLRQNGTLFFYKSRHNESIGKTRT